MKASKIFVPELLLNELLSKDLIEINEGELIVLGEGRVFSLTEGIHITAEVTGATEKERLTGKVLVKQVLEEKGAEILENSMVLGDYAYDITQGFVLSSTLHFQKHLTSPKREAARLSYPGFPEVRSDEALLGALAAMV